MHRLVINVSVYMRC